MGYICRFCEAVGHINIAILKREDGPPFNLEWCSECGAVQTKFR